MIRKNFNSNWQVEKGSSSSRMDSFLGKADTKTVHLPHDAMIHEERLKDTPNGAQTGFYPGGEYIYQKKFHVPIEWREKHAVLEFEGVYQTSLIYINGEFVTKNVNGYSGFFIDLNPWLKYGEDNQIKVIADNSLEPNSRWYTGSGIYRNVNLMLGGKVYVQEDGVRITTKHADEQSAIMEVELKTVSISQVREQIMVRIIIEKDGENTASDTQKVTVFPGEQITVRSQFCIEQPKLWDCEHPELYHCRIVIEQGEEQLDCCFENFGIRTITVDPIYGLRINGKETKLRGACIHHDNGVIGAATLEKAEEYRLRKLKEAGFNSIRSSHHPISRAMLNACDRYGMLVMDELTDVWTIRKNPYDYAWHFKEDWENSIEKMVAKDYNHPSVILYSMGNEIAEVGSEAGARINRMLCNKFHKEDETRYTINALNGLMAAGYRLRDIMKDVAVKFGNTQSAAGSNQQGSNALNSFMSLMEGEKGDYFSQHPLLTEALSGCSDSSDIIGLNYLTGRHVLERELHPNKTVIGTETYPADIIRLWKIVKENSHVLGDYTWAGYDYLGEAGCGIFHYDGNANFSSVYPERTAYIGDIDLIGCRRPISYLREIVYGLRKDPYIAVERIDKYGKQCTKTPWMFKDNISSWTWHGYEGQKTSVDVYSQSEEVELFINGRSLGRRKAGEDNGFTATYEISYEPGELRAVGYSGGMQDGEFSIVTAEQHTQIKLETNRETFVSDGEDLAFVLVKFVDDNGTENLFDKQKVQITVEGAGSLEGFGSANPSSQEKYDDDTAFTYDGYCLAVVRAGEMPGKLRLSFSSEGFETKTLELDVVEPEI